MHLNALSPKIVLCVIFIFLWGCASSMKNEIAERPEHLFIFYFNSDKGLASFQKDTIVAGIRAHPEWEAWLFFAPPSKTKQKRSTIEFWREGRWSTIETWKEVDFESLQPLDCLTEDIIRINRISAEPSRHVHFHYWGQNAGPFFKKMAEKLGNSISRLRDAHVTEGFVLTSLIVEACAVDAAESFDEFKPLTQSLTVVTRSSPQCNQRYGR